MFQLARHGAKRARTASMESPLSRHCQRRRPPKRRQKEEDTSEHNRESEYQRQQSAPEVLQALTETTDTLQVNPKTNNIAAFKGNLIREFDPNTKFDPSDASICGIKFNEIGDLCIADSANGKIKMFDQNGRLKVECLVPMRDGSSFYPHGLGVTYRGNVVTSDKSDNSIKTFTPCGRLYNTLHLDCSRAGCLCSVKDDKAVVINEEDDSLLIVTNVSGSNHTTTKLSKDHTGALLFKRPFDASTVTMDNREHLVISDAFDKKLIFLDPANKEVTRKSLNIVDPCGISIYRDNDILVADRVGNKIVHIKGPTFDECHTILGPDQGIDMPLLVTVSPLGLIAVVESDQTCVKIFK